MLLAYTLTSRTVKVTMHLDYANMLLYGLKQSMCAKLCRSGDELCGMGLAREQKTYFGVKLLYY